MCLIVLGTLHDRIHFAHDFLLERRSTAMRCPVALRLHLVSSVSCLACLFNEAVRGSVYRARKD
jgi:hypothetical protein